MRLYSFKKLIRQSNARFAPVESWKNSARELLLAQIRKDPLWRDAPASVREPAAFARLFNVLLAQAALKPAVAFVLIFAVVSYSSVFTVQAARASLPGDALYSVKLGLEAAQVGVAFSESKKAELEISFATTRLAEVSEILSQDPAAANTPHIEQAIKRFASDLGSVQKRLEKLGQEEKSEEKVLKISKFVNDKTSELEVNLLVIKEKLADQKSEAALSDAPVLAPDAPAAPLGDGVAEESGSASGADPGAAALASENDSTASTSAQALGELSTTTTPAASETTSEAKSQNAKTADTAAEKDLLTTLNNALDVVGQTNIKSLEVFVGKAQTSKSETVQQEAVDKIQKKIDTTLVAAEKLSDTNAAALSASSTFPVLDKDTNAAAAKSALDSQQVKEAIDEAKKILDSKNISDLGKAVDKVKEAKEIVQDAANAAESREQDAGTSQKQDQDTKNQVPSTSASSTASSLNQDPDAKSSDSPSS